MAKFVLLTITEDISVKVERFEAKDFAKSWEEVDTYARPGVLKLILTEKQAESFTNQLR